MAKEFVGVWRKYDLVTDKDFSFFYLRVNKKDGNNIEGSGFDDLGVFDVKGEIGPGHKIVKTYENGIKIPHEILQFPEKGRGNWRIGNDSGVFYLVGLNEFSTGRTDKTNTLAMRLLECHASIIADKTKGHEDKFPIGLPF